MADHGALWWLVHIGVWLLLGGFVFLLPSVILRASCSLADVKEPNYLICLPVALGAVALFVALHWTALSFLFGLGVGGVPDVAYRELTWLDDTFWQRSGSAAFAGLPSDAIFGAFMISLFLVALPVVVLLAALAYHLIFAPSFLKGLRIASVQAGLQSLALFLAVGVWLVVISIVKVCGASPNGAPAPSQAPTAHVVAVDPL
jgi:hypothetical protein